MPDQSRRPASSLVPILALAAIMLLGLAGWRLFPLLQHYVAYQDCIASFRTNCQ